MVSVQGRIVFWCLNTLWKTCASGSVNTVVVVIIAGINGYVQL